MAYSDKLLSRTVTICLGPDNAVTHAFQTDLVQVMKDGAPFGSPQQGNHENLEPADIAAAVPQAAVLKQLNDVKAELEQTKAAAITDAEAAAKTAASELSGVQAKLEGTKAAATAAADVAAHTIADLQSQLDQVNGRLARVLMHVGQLGAAVEQVTAPAA